MKIKVINKEEYPVSVWSGGTTTQLYIYPDDSEYAKRNFLFRLSSATVDCESSTFTALPGVSRIILPLDGALHLFYEGHGEKLLNEYEQDSFDGGWNTTSVGKATDFNLMMREGATGSIEVKRLGDGEMVLENKDGGMLLIFVSEGSCCVGGKEADNRSLVVCEGDGSIKVKGYDGCVLVCARVKVEE